MDACSQFLADQLERLSRLPLITPADVEAWDEQAADVQTELERRFAGLGFPHAIHHYFTDSDIRARDTGYREWQERFIAEYVARVRHESAA